MEIHERTTGEVTVLALEGRFDAPSAPEAEQAFRRVTEAGACRIVLDLSGVEYISSGGLRAIIVLLKTLDRAGGRLVLCCLSPFVAEVFEITHLADRVTIQPTQDHAVRLLRE